MKGGNYVSSASLILRSAMLINVDYQSSSLWSMTVQVMKRTCIKELMLHNGHRKQDWLYQKGLWYIGFTVDLYCLLLSFTFYKPINKGLLYQQLLALYSTSYNWSGSFLCSFLYPIFSKKSPHQLHSHFCIHLC